MSIEGLAQVSSLGGRIKTSANEKGMGKEDFLQMLVAQLRSQDPLNPMDSTSFTAQLAQFSSLEQLQNINAGLAAMGSAQNSLANSQAVTYIGKSIIAVGDSIEMQDGQAQSLTFSLSRPAAGSYLKIYDSNGNFIRQIENGPLAAGEHAVSWDGRDYLGGRSPDGTYRFEVAAIDENGNSVAVTLFTWGVVSGVHFNNGQAYLQCGGRETPMSNVVKVRSETTGQ